MRKGARNDATGGCWEEKAFNGGVGGGLSRREGGPVEEGGSSC